MADSKSVRTAAEALTRTLEKIHSAIAKKNESEAIALLKKLESNETPSREVLQETKAGAAINKLSKKGPTAVQAAATAVLNVWKNAHAGSGKPKRKREDGADGAAGGADGAGPSGSGEKKVKLEDGKSVKKEQLIKSETNGASSSRSSPAPPRKPRTTIRKHSTPRTATLDKPDPSWVKPAFTDAEDEKGMKLRERGVIMFYDALAFDNMEDSKVICGIACQLEQAVFTRAGKTTGDAYRSKTRELYMSIKEATNDVLRDMIVKGEHSPHDVVNLSQDELKPKSVVIEEAEIDKQNMFEARGAGQTEAETDAFKCGKCGQRKTTYYQMQTRSADEPMTTFVTCVNCNNRWKFC